MDTNVRTLVDNTLCSLPNYINSEVLRMDKSTVMLLEALSDSVQFDGYTQEISMIIRHKLSPQDRIKVLHDVTQLIDQPTK